MLVLAVLYFRRTPAERTSTVRFFISPPEKVTITHESDEWHFLAVSPDGRQVAFIATLEGKKLLWVHSLDALSARALPGTEGALSPFWSPNRHTIGFFADGKLKKVEVSGGPPQTLCDVSTRVSNGTWGRQGTILFDNWERGPQGIYAVPDTGGEATLVTKSQKAGNDLAWPYFLQDGRHFLYSGYDLASNKSSIYVASLDSHDARRVMQADSRVAYAPPGYLLYVREGTLLGQPFDAENLRLVGEPFPIAERIDYFKQTGYGAFAVSENGVLCYVAGEPSSRMVWLSRSGGEIGSIGTPRGYKRLRFSPEVQKVIAEVRDSRTGTTDLWIYESLRHLETRFTFGGVEVDSYSPVWSPDGRRLVFSQDRGGPPHLYQKLSTGTGSEEMLLPVGGIQYAHDWSPDGRFILYEDSDPKTGVDLWILPILGDRKPVPFVHSAFNETDARFSPDGRWVAFVSDESGRSRVYVQPLQGSGEKWPISTAGGSRPRWRRDGKELYYLAADNKLMAVALNAGHSFTAGPPAVLFKSNMAWNDYDVAPDGKQFLVSTQVAGAESTPITVVLNWTASLK
jgi:eukaryotic-like serine/threonine-protein kinase